MNWATQTSKSTSQRFVEAAVIGRDLLGRFVCHRSKRARRPGVFPG
jgi:hypothetical protein